MAKIRWCKKDCGYQALKGRQFCKWHALLRMSSHEQAAAALTRLNRGLLAGEERARVPRSEWPTGERWCAGCQSFVPLFYTTGSRCKACASSAAHGRRLERTYGISSDEYDRIFAMQNGECAICKRKSRSVRLAVDHDHSFSGPGNVRGLLCKRCNHDLLGASHESIELLWRAIQYLLYPPAQCGGADLISSEDQLAGLTKYLDSIRTKISPKIPPF